MADRSLDPLTIIRRCRELRAEFQAIHLNTSRPLDERIAEESRLIDELIELSKINFTSKRPTQIQPSRSRLAALVLVFSLLTASSCWHSDSAAPPPQRPPHPAPVAAKPSYDDALFIRDSEKRAVQECDKELAEARPAHAAAMKILNLHEASLDEWTSTDRDVIARRDNQRVIGQASYQQFSDNNAERVKHIPTDVDNAKDAVQKIDVQLSHLCDERERREARLNKAEADVEPIRGDN